MVTRCVDLVLEFEFDSPPDDQSDEQYDEYETQLAIRQAELIQKINTLLVAESASVTEA